MQKWLTEARKIMCRWRVSAFANTSPWDISVIVVVVPGCQVLSRFTACTSLMEIPSSFLPTTPSVNAFHRLLSLASRPGLSERRDKTLVDERQGQAVAGDCMRGRGAGASACLTEIAFSRLCSRIMCLSLAFLLSSFSCASLANRWPSSPSPSSLFDP